MAQPMPGEQIAAGELLAPPPPASVADSQRFIPTPFLTKTYQLVEDVSIDSIISWNEDGTAFVVWNPAEFARDVLPKYFKHNNFSSFVRQLNTYGFRKIVPDRWEFSNDCFRRGDKRLLCDIVRRKLNGAVSGLSGVPAVSSSTLTASIEPSTSGEGQVFSANSSQHSVAAPVITTSVTTSTMMFLEQNNTSSRANLIDENDRLKKENTQLCKELSHMKSMCTNIYSMMSNFNPGQGPAGPGPPGVGCVSGYAGAGGCVSTNSSQAESGMVPQDVIAQRRLLALATAAEAPPVAADILSLDPRLFGFAIGSKRARGHGQDRGVGVGEPKEQDYYLQLQQPGPRS